MKKLNQLKPIPIYGMLCFTCRNVGMLFFTCRKFVIHLRRLGKNINPIKFIKLPDIIFHAFETDL